jgi:indolepyruvate ferredoxin oxidoreductase alpha subunit
MTVFILDNSTVAMTGGQPTFLSGEKLAKVIEGLGVAKEHIRTILPLPKNHDENVLIMKQEFDYQGLSVVIAARECVQQARRRKRSTT